MELVIFRTVDVTLEMLREMPDVDEAQQRRGVAILPQSLVMSASARALQLAAVLALHANSGFVAFPSRSSLARELRCSQDTVDRAVSELQRLGAIQVHRRESIAGDNTSNAYRLLWSTGGAS